MSRRSMVWAKLNEQVEAPQVAQQIVQQESDTKACQKCGKVILRGIYMHQKYCKGASNG